MLAGQHLEEFDVKIKANPQMLNINFGKPFVFMLEIKLSVSIFLRHRKSTSLLMLDIELYAHFYGNVH